MLTFLKWIPAFAAMTAAAANAQRPDLHWRTLTTQHFYIHFTPPVEPLARRLAVDAERAYAQLSTELHPPRGMIDVVLSDDFDVSNGSATPTPYNRIIVYASPPVDESALRYTNDWGQMVITHELTHIFHLDRSRGIWQLAQHVFGRSPFLFPNLYSPSWLTEGIAVHEESALAGEGRIEGPEHRLIVRSAAAANSLPSLGTIGLATPRYPQGEAAYAYGSLFVDYMARKYGEQSLRSFVESSSDQLIPYLIDLPAHHAFGISFDKAYNIWRDSITRAVAAEPSNGIQGWTSITHDGLFASYPRWSSDSSLVYVGTNGRDPTAAFRLSLTGDRSTLGARNSLAPNDPLDQRTTTYTQLEYTNLYQERSDLYQQTGNAKKRLTYGARLTDADVRADGEIVAEQIIPGGTQLVLVSRDGKSITRITNGSYDEQWAEPRWSHAGDRIVASHWKRGGIAQIVVLDTTGRIVHLAASGHGVAATPSWLPNDAGIMFAYGEGDHHDAYIQTFYTSWDSVPPQFRSTLGPRYPSRTTRLASPVGGVYDPTPSPAGDRLAGSTLMADGYHIGVAPCCRFEGTEVLILDTLPDPRAPAVQIDTTPSKSYSPWRTLLPRYWIPESEAGFKSGAYRFGANTRADDAIGRHHLDATLYVPTDNSGLTGGASYEYDGLGQPQLEVDASQDWSRIGTIINSEASHTVLGDLRRRERAADISTTWTRQRVRTGIALTTALGLDRREYLSVPDGLIPLVDTTGRFTTSTVPVITVAGGFAHYTIPPFGISPENGLTANLTVRDRLHGGPESAGPQTLSTIVSASTFAALPLPGYAHSVFALRAAAGVEDSRSLGYFDVGGVSGSTFQIVPGVAIGEGRETFGVRGFEPGTVIGTNAVAGSAEYRMPLTLNEGAVGILPFFLERSSLTFFYDYGVAWCPSAGSDRAVCNDAGLERRSPLSSAGAELNVNAGVLSWDQPYRFRVGVARPLANRLGAGRPNLVWYLASGVSF